MNFTKNDIATGLRGSSEWRKGRDEAFPGDSRNRSAATRLAELADEADHMTEADGLHLAPYADLPRGKWLHSLSLACRHVEFSRPTPDLPTFLTNLAALLNAKVAA